MQRQDNFRPLFENGPIRGNVYDVSPSANCKDLPTYEYFRDRIRQLLPTYLREDMKLNKKSLSLGFLRLESFCRRMQREDGPFSQIAEMKITPEMLSEIRYGIINMYYNPATKLKFLIFKNALDAEYIESLELSIYKIKSVRLTKIFDSPDILITIVLDG